MGASLRGAEGRPQVAVISTAGVRYDANNLVIAWDWHSEGWVLQFLCSGSLTTLRAGEVQRIEYAPAGGQLCGFCDRPLLGAVPQPFPGRVAPDAG